MYTVTNAQLAQDRRDVGLDGCFAEVELLGEFRVGASLGDELEDLALALGEPLEFAGSRG